MAAAALRGGRAEKGVCPRETRPGTLGDSRVHEKRLLPAPQEQCAHCDGVPRGTGTPLALRAPRDCTLSHFLEVMGNR